MPVLIALSAMPDIAMVPLIRFRFIDEETNAIIWKENTPEVGSLKGVGVLTYHIWLR